MRRSHFLLGLCTRYSTTSARSIFLLLLYMLIYLAKLHGNYVVFCRRSTISSIYLIPFTVITCITLCVFPIPYFMAHVGKWSCFLVYIMKLVCCVCSLLYSPFEVRSDGMITSGICRKIIDFLFAFRRHSDPTVSRKRGMTQIYTLRRRMKTKCTR